MILRITYCLLLLAVSVSAFAVEVGKLPNTNDNVRIKKAVSGRQKRSLVDYGDEMTTVETDDICAPADGAVVESGSRRMQTMRQLNKIPKCDAGEYAKPFCNTDGLHGINYKCVPCPIGYFKSKPGNKGCARCASYQSTNSTGAVFCTNLCQKGQYLAVNAPRSDRECLDCPIGEYMPMKSLEPSCIPCPNGKTTMGTGSRGKWQCVHPTTTAPPPTTPAPPQLPDIVCESQSQCLPYNAFCDRYRPEGEPQKCRCPWNQHVTQEGVCSTDPHPNFVCHDYTSADRARAEGEREQCEGFEPWLAGNRVFMAGLPNFGECSSRGCWCCERDGDPTTPAPPPTTAAPTTPPATTPPPTTPPPTSAAPPQLPDINCNGQADCSSLNAFCDRYRPEGEPQKCRCPWNQHVTQEGVCSTDPHPNFVCHDYTSADRARAEGEREQCEGFEPWLAGDRVFMAGLPNFGECSSRGCWCCERDSDPTTPAPPPPTTAAPTTPPTTTQPPTTQPPTSAAPLQLPDINCNGQADCSTLNAFCDRYRPEGEPQKCRCPWNQHVTQEGVCSTDSHPNFVCHDYTSEDRARAEGEREQCEGFEPWLAGDRVFMAGLPNFGECSSRGCWCCERDGDPTTPAPPPTTAAPTTPPATTPPPTTPPPTSAAPPQLPDINCNGQADCSYLNAFCDHYRPEGEPQKCRCPWNQHVTQEGVCSTDPHPNFVCHDYTSADRARAEGEREQCEGFEPWLAGDRVFMAGLPNFGECSSRGCWCCELGGK